jgi:hypothetical protein
MILNITWSGVSVDTVVGFDGHATDNDLKRVAVEMIRSGDVSGLLVRTLPADAFDDFVVDRFDTPEGGKRLFLRPKVPFGA